MRNPLTDLSIGSNPQRLPIGGGGQGPAIKPEKEIMKQTQFNPFEVTTDRAVYRTFNSYGFNRVFRHGRDCYGVMKYPGEQIGGSAVLDSDQLKRELILPYIAAHGETVVS